MILTGLARIGRDAEVRYAGNGDAVINLALAYNYGQKEATTGKKPTQWVDASLWGKRAEALAQYLVRGQMLDVVITDVHVNVYEKKDGTTGSSMRGKVSELEFAGSPPQAQDAAPPARAAAPAQRTAAPARAAAPARGTPAPAEHFEDDDIPF